ncbi:disease resistance protein RPV1-like [Alnus glutinosa]|uniref:disease resistance protein RPV1-like n=1 Tax=Alnus glutinosa TaxID=3517 RepID=UPI002D7654E6|nr:disease resistance protein RPV1-like [Alnus glutinosa]
MFLIFGIDRINESKFIHAIVEDISCQVRPPHLYVAQYPVGIESRVKKIKGLLKLEMNDICMVGIIFGIMGIGKTTIAKAIYNSIAYQFQGSCFLEKVSETSGQPNGLVRLQEKLLYAILRDSSLKVDSVEQGINLIKQKLSSKKVLLILDGVDRLLQLEALAGQRAWFGSGSRIIFTARDTNLQTEYEVDATYEVKGLDPNEAHQLFCWHAFKKDKPDDDYVELTKHAIHLAGGLPLSLVVQGSSLCGRSVAEWITAFGL